MVRRKIEKYEYDTVPRFAATVLVFAAIAMSLIIGFILITILWSLKFWALVIVIVVASVYWLARPLIDWVQEEL